MRELLAGYPLSDARFDELFAGPGRPRPHWARLLDALAHARPERLRERVATVERDIRDSGLTYNIYADPRGADRPWRLDALPLILPAQEWQYIATAIAQRARLLDAVLTDLYGPQRLLTRGDIPPALVVGHGAFQRAACGTQWPGGQPLLVHAADLARSPDGRWWVVADRTQAPSGAGYALENRLIVSRVFPGLFQSLHTERLAGFFATMRQTLLERSPSGDGPHLTVLLTPGPYNETYSEHSLLARYLGFTLVEGGDLTVRAGKVWLKGVDGLRRVHAILRRQDDDFCDPLELRADSALGVPGLVDCARRGNVLIANAIGSGLIESGAFMGFLPRLCEQLLGESLAMPSVATWWLGEPAALADALPRLGELVFKSIDPSVPAETVFGEDLDARQARTLLARIRRQPGAWVAQERVALSQAPVFERASAPLVGARSVSLRVFAVASSSGWVVMPGGLTRVAGSQDARVVTMQRGGASKDTWVLSDMPVNGSLTLLQPTVGPCELVRTASASLSSRSAENLFWFGRYVERSEALARLLRMALPWLSVDDDDRQARAPLLALAGALGVPLTPPAGDGAESLEAMLMDAVFNGQRRGALPEVLAQLQRLAFSLRERLSVDHWRAISRLVPDAVGDAGKDLSRAMAYLDRTLAGLTTLSGFMFDGMTRDTGWRFVSAGRRLERLRAVCAALAAACSEGRAAGLDWLLEYADSAITYRSRYLGQPEWLPVLDLLLRDDTNPRSVAFQLKGLADALGRIDQVVGSSSLQQMPPILASLDRWDDPSDLSPGPALTDWLIQVCQGAAELSDRLSMTFFTHAHDTRRTLFAA